MYNVIKTLDGHPIASVPQATRDAAFAFAESTYTTLCADPEAKRFAVAVIESKQDDDGNLATEQVLRLVPTAADIKKGVASRVPSKGRVK